MTDPITSELSDDEKTVLFARDIFRFMQSQANTLRKVDNVELSLQVIIGAMATALIEVFANCNDADAAVYYSLEAIPFTWSKAIEIVQGFGVTTFSDATVTHLKNAVATMEHLNSVRNGAYDA